MRNGWGAIRGSIFVSVLAWSGALAQENAVCNPGFEETGPGGAVAGWSERKPAYRFADGAGRNGSRGLAFDNSDPKFYSFPSQKLDLQPGRCYAFEVWVKTEGLTGDESGATACMEWSGADGKYLGGAYPEGVRGTSDGWVKVRGVTRALPTNAVRVTLAPYVRRGMTGKAWFDDLQVTRYYPPLVSAVSASCYRHTAAGRPVTFSAGLPLAESGVGVGEVSGLFTIKRADGQAVRETAPDALTPDCARLTVDASSLPAGAYTVSFAVTTQDGASKGAAETPFSRVERLPERRAYIDGHRRLIVDGQPFFPLGMYWSGVKEPELDTYAKGPFNCLMPYGSPTTNQMDACHARGLKVIYSIKDFYSGTRWAPKGMKTEADELAEIKRRVALHGRHPALIAWYINDEMPLEMVGRLAARQRLMEELDPDHPTWGVLYQSNQVRSYMATFDVIGTDPYPIPGKPAGTALEWTRATRDQSYGTRAVWQVPLVFDWGAYRKGDEREKTRAPTLEEMRSMAWQCVAAGANGLVFYSFFDLFKMKDRDPFEKRWAEVCKMAEEIKRFIPVLLSAEPAPAVTCEGAPMVETRVCKKDGEVYLLAVNGGSEPASATVTVAGGCAAARAEFGSAPAVKEGGKLAFTFAPLEPVMVRLTF
jgi:hypothetical protein